MRSRWNLSVIVLSLLLAGMLAPVLMPETVHASNTIYIKSDGSIAPSGANITTADSQTYTFTGNVNDSIIIQRDNIVVDGAGYQLTGTGEYAISLTYRTNVTIRNLRIKDSPDTGILLDSCSFCSLTSNVLVDNGWHGIYLYDSTNNSISHNNITRNHNRAIYLEYSSDNSIIGNKIYDNDHRGIEIKSLSQSNNISDNIIQGNSDEGIILSSYCDHNSICRNNVTDNKSSGIVAQGNSLTVCDNILRNNTNVGLIFGQSLNSTITGNEATGNFYGIRMAYASNTMMRDNVMFGNHYDFDFGFIDSSDFPNDVDESNTVEGRPIIYWLGKRNMTVPVDAGVVILFNCTDMTIQNLNITDPTEDAVIVAYCANTTIANNHISNSSDCILLWNCSNCIVTSNSLRGFMSIQLFNSTANTIFNNTITGGGNMGAVSLEMSRDNTFYRNNFTNNYADVLVGEQWPNNWDHGYEDGGNYWDNYIPRFHSNARDDYSGPYQNETGSDGYWDYPYPLNDNNTDRYALVPEYSSTLTLLLLVSTTPLAIAIIRRRTASCPK